MAKFKTSELRRKFELSRLLLRTILSEQFDRPPDELAISIAPDGRPQLDDFKNGDFNLSHSKNSFLLGISTDTDRRIGVDVEGNNDHMNYASLIKRYFHPNETTAFEKVEPQDVRDQFLRLWTLKEAFAKTAEASLADALANFAFDISDAVPRLTGRDHDKWRFCSFKIEKEWAAVACRSNTPVNFLHHQWPSPFKI